MNIRFLIVSLLFSLFSVILPIKGLSFPMEIEAFITKGFPIAFYSFVDPHSYEGVLSFFNLKLAGINLVNFLFNTFILYVLLFFLYKLLITLNVLKANKENKHTT